MHACLLCFIFQLERTYQQKSDSLLQKERNSIERMQREQEVVYWQYSHMLHIYILKNGSINIQIFSFFFMKMHEKEIYSQRQSILEEIEVLRKREAEVKRSSDSNERFTVLSFTALQILILQIMLLLL